MHLAYSPQNKLCTISDELCFDWYLGAWNIQTHVFSTGPSLLTQYTPDRTKYWTINFSLWSENVIQAKVRDM